MSDVVALRSANWQLTRSVDYTLFHCDHLSLDVLWGSDRQSDIRIRLQNVEMGSLDKTMERLDHLIRHMRCIRTISFNLETPHSSVINAVIERLLDADNVRLEVIKMNRRYVGQRVELLPDLITANAESLRVVKKIGLSEAVECLNEKLHLDHLSLMNFDLVVDGELENPLLDERSQDCIRRIAGLGATFTHLSYTTYTGFNLSRNPTLFMLRQCAVRSIRLTMQKGVAIAEPSPMGQIRPLLENLQKLELVGLLNAPRGRLTTLFPNLEHYHHQKINLATGSVC